MFTSSRALLAGVLLFLAYVPLDYVVRAWLYFSEVATPEEWRQAYSGFALTVSRDHPRRQEVTFPVALVMCDGSEVVVSDAPGKAQARATARLVADVVGVEVTANTSE